MPTSAAALDPRDLLDALGRDYVALPPRPGASTPCSLLAALNLDGGAIKGSAADRLEQSSTRAEPIAVELADGVYSLPSCYYEFARRYPLPSGELFSGFVPASADKLFQSTDAGR